MELEFLSAGTVAKFIIKSSCLLLLLISILSAETTDEIYSTAHCYHVSHACINAMLPAGLLSVKLYLNFLFGCINPKPLFKLTLWNTFGYVQISCILAKC